MIALGALIRIAISFLSVFYLIRFLLGIFAPGNAENAAAVQALMMIFAYLDPVLILLKLPVDLVLGALTHAVPMLKAWLPAMPAAGVFAWLAELLTLIPGFEKTDLGRDILLANYPYLFPGRLDWSMLLAIPFWQTVERIITAFLLKIDRGVTRLRKQERMQRLEEEMMTRYQSQEKAPAALQQQSPEKTLLFTQVAGSLKKEMQGWQGMANLDSVTQLFNRKHFTQALEMETDNAKKRHGWLSVLLLGIDDYEAFVAAHGQEFTDKILNQAAKAFSGTVPANSKTIAARYEKDVLAMVITDATVETARHLADAVSQQVATVMLPEKTKARITGSIGVYTVCFVPYNGSHGMSAQDLISKADAELYKARRMGKGRVSANALP